MEHRIGTAQARTAALRAPVVYEAALEVRAGSPLSIPRIPDLTVCRAVGEEVTVRVTAVAAVGDRPQQALQNREDASLMRSNMKLGWMAKGITERAKQ